MFTWFTHTLSIQSSQDVQAGESLIAGKPYGVIEAVDGKWTALHLRPWPKMFAWPDIWPVGKNYRAPGEADRCLLYYNQPRSYSQFLALRYMVAQKGTSFATFRASLVALDWIAQIKQTDALLCDAANQRLSDRLMHRFGWESHKPSRWHRNYIKRFYGRYPTPPQGLLASHALS